MGIRRDITVCPIGRRSWRENNLDSEEIFEKTTKTIVDDRGRIYIPKNIRRQLGIKEGDKLLIVLVDDCLEIYTRMALKSQIENSLRSQSG
jgi:AbrB family looped-hinge helix DNA binding protein